MKKNSLTNNLLLAAVIAIGFTACKKDNPKPEPPKPKEIVSISITDLKKRNAGTIDETGKILRIKGVVISDKDAKNIDAKTAILQEGNNPSGLVINFAAAHSFALGDEVEVGVSNQKLEQVNGEIVLNAIPVDSASKKGAGVITPLNTTIAAINTNKAAWNGTLVSISATELSSPDGKYKGTLNIKDASGSLSSVVFPGSTLEDAALPASVSKITGIVRVNGANTRIDIRNQDDVIAAQEEKSVEIDLNALFISLIPDEFTEPKFAYIGGSLLGDEGFTEAAKKYFYMFLKNKDRPVDALFIPAVDSKLVRTVTITFAGSRVQGKVDADRVGIPNFRWNNNLALYYKDPFNEATDEIKIGVRLYEGTGNNSLSQMEHIIESESYKKVGEFYTCTLTLPTTVAELTALGYDEADAPKLLQSSPYILIENRSVGKGILESSGYELNSHPILIKKIEFGY